MTWLTITPAMPARAKQSAARARADRATHHPPRPLLAPLETTGPPTTPGQGRLLCDLLKARIAIYSPLSRLSIPTAGGINQRLAEGLGLADVLPARPAAGRILTVQPPTLAPDVSWRGPAGRVTVDWHRPATALAQRRIKQFLRDWATSSGLARPTGLWKRWLLRAVVPGEFLEPALAAGCKLLVTGEVGFHTCLKAEALDVVLLLVGHFASERFAVEALAEVLAKQFPALSVWASRHESDPLRVL